MFYLLDEIANIGIFILGGTKHENTIWFYFDQQWGTETNKSEAENVALIFNFYMAGASLGKVVDMLYAKQNTVSDRKGEMDSCRGRPSSL